jgi:hypothetical protein
VAGALAGELEVGAGFLRTGVAYSSAQQKNETK